MDKVRDREETLFTKWREIRQPFVPDGVVDEAAYESSSPRLLFVLKEVNNYDGDLRQFLREGGRVQTWNNVTRWVNGIRNLQRDIQWSELENIDNKRRKITLVSIAAVNLKKSPGSHTSDDAAIEKTASQDRDFLNDQFQLYDPDFIICCGVSGIVRRYIDLGVKPDWKKTSRGIGFYEFKPKKVLIDFHHPGARCAPSLLYYGLVDAVREIQDNSGSAST